MSWRRSLGFASLLITILGIPGTVENVPVWLDWFEKAHRWFAEMSFYQQVAPFLFYGGLAAMFSWLVWYKLPDWLTASERQFRQHEIPIRECLEMMFTMAHSISENPFDPPPGWVELRAGLVSLDQDLASLRIPRPPIPDLADYDLAEYLTWQEYLTHLAPMARNGRLKDARRMRISGSERSEG